MLDDFFEKGFCVISDVLPLNLVEELREHETNVSAHHGFDFENNYITGIEQKDQYIQYSTNEITTKFSNKVKEHINKYI